MGCVASKLDINDVHPNMFSVVNVNDNGVKLSSGHLEITETDLILYLKGKQPVRWPLKYLKRYGFEDGLFSFEAGRKTVSPGVYAFKCRRAEKLFNLLQVRVRELGVSLSLSTTQPLLDQPDQEQSPGSPGGSVTDRGDYINCNITATASTPSYLNITQELPNTSQDPRHEYENIGPDLLQSPDYLPVSLQPSAEEDSQSVSQPSPPVNSINYIVLDLDTSNTNHTTEDMAHLTAADHNQGAGAGPATDTTTRGRGYVTIDFDKTDALIKSANQRFVEDDDPGTRKTRHNSSLSDLAPVKLVN